MKLEKLDEKRYLYFNLMRKYSNIEIQKKKIIHVQNHKFTKNQEKQSNQSKD